MSLSRNIKWAAVSQGGRISVQFLSLWIFTKLLSPADFGLMAMAGVVTNLALTIRDTGMSAAIINRETVDQQICNTAFSVNILFGLCLAGAIFICAPIAGAYFHHPELQSLLFLVSIVFPIANSASVHQALLERQGAFKDLARIELTSAVGGLAVGVIVARNGGGAFSLAAQSLFQASFSSVQLWVKSGWKPSSTREFTGLRQLSKFTGGVTAFSLINYFARNIDSLIVGRALGDVALGAYSVALKIMLLPVQSLSAVVSRAMYPVLSRYQRDLGRMGLVYWKAVSLVVLISTPMMTVLYVFRGQLIDQLLGHKWAAIGPLLVWLAPTGIIQSVNSTSGALLMACGRTKLLILLSTFSAIVCACAFIAGVQVGLAFMTKLYFFANVLMLIGTSYCINRIVGTPVRTLLSLAFPPLMGLITIVLLMRLLQGSAVFSSINPHYSLLLSIVAAFFAYLSIWVVLSRKSPWDLVRSLDG